MAGRKLDYQAIQIDLRGEILRRYRDEFIIKVEDVSNLAVEIGQVARKRQNVFPIVPLEEDYPIDRELEHLLGYE